MPGPDRRMPQVLNQKVQELKKKACSSCYSFRGSDHVTFDANENNGEVLA